jgi:hypothetical protein
LKATLYYYEHVAISKNDSNREMILNRTKRKLQEILKTLVEGIESK